LGNFEPGKTSKYRDPFMNKLIDFINNTECKIEYLSLSGRGKHGIGRDIIPFIQSLLQNSTITELDISGHGFGDAGAIWVSKVIQQNKTLKSLKLDENKVSPLGFRSLAIGME